MGFITPLKLTRAAALGAILIAALGVRAHADTCSDSSSPGLLSGFFQKLIRATCQECNQLHVSCDLVKTRQIPEVLFLGEDHDNKLSIQTRKSVLDSASRGQFPLATEVGMNGGFLPWETRAPNIHGIESMIPFGVFTSYTNQRELIDGEDTAKILVGEVGNAVEKNPLFGKAYENLRKRSPHSCLSCFSIIDQVTAELSKLHPDPANKFIPDDLIRHRLFRRMQKIDASQRARFIGEIDREVLRIVRENYPDLIHPDSLPDVETKAEADRFGILKGEDPPPGSPFSKILMDVRNPLFAEQIANDLCHYAGKSRYLVVLMGNNHVDGVKRLLDGLSGGKLRSRHYRTWNEFDVQEFTNLIGR